MKTDPRRVSLRPPSVSAVRPNMNRACGAGARTAPRVVRRTGACIAPWVVRRTGAGSHLSQATLGPSRPHGPRYNDQAAAVHVPRAEHGRRRRAADGRARTRRHARRRRNRPVPEHEAAAVRAQGARRAPWHPRTARHQGLYGRRLDDRRRDDALGCGHAPRHHARFSSARNGRRVGLLASAPEHGYHRGQRVCGYPMQLLQSVLRVA